MNTKSMAKNGFISPTFHIFSVLLGHFLFTKYVTTQVFTKHTYHHACLIEASLILETLDSPNFNGKKLLLQ